MSLNEILTQLVDALFEANSPGYDRASDETLPDFLISANGSPVSFNSSARNYLGQLAKTLHENSGGDIVKIELGPYMKVVRSVIANMLSEGVFDATTWHKGKSAVKELKARIASQLDKLAKEHTHFFPAWTLSMERNSPIEVGPVRIMSRGYWLDTVDFSERYKRDLDIESDWKALVTQALNSSDRNIALSIEPRRVYAAIKECPAIIETTIAEHEQGYSERFAKLACKTALDSISLICGTQESFLQQALYCERLPPFNLYSLIETNGYLNCAGWARSKRFSKFDGNTVLECLSNFPVSLKDIGKIIDGVINPQSCPWPKLALRWTTSLNWLAEACRDESDQMAIAKLGTSLDVLACGGKQSGIADMVSNYTGIEKKEPVNDSTTLTLSNLIRKIYEEGRSQILHGTNIDRLELLIQERDIAFQIARVALLEAAHRLMSYEGPDNDKAFRTMPAPA